MRAHTLAVQQLEAFVNVTCAQEVSPTDIGHLLLLQVHTLLSRVDLFIESISALGHTREQLMFQPNL